MVAWGINDFGQLGNGTTSYATSPGEVVGLEGIAVSDIAAAGWHSLAITTSGGLLACHVTVFIFPFNFVVIGL